MAKVVQLQPTTTLRTPIGHAIRTGEASYRRLEDLHAEGRLPARAVIVDASKARFQREFVRSLRATNADVTLDPKVAELSEVGKFRGSAKESPWAVDDNTRPLEPEDFEPGAVTDLFGKFARMAAELDVTSVMAPTHLLRPGVDNLGLPIDCRSVGLLRDALDREAGRHVAIDYPLILPHTRLLDDRYLPRILTALRGLPVDNLVVRLSGFGADAGPFTVKRTLGAIEELQVLGYPHIARLRRRAGRPRRTRVRNRVRHRARNRRTRPVRRPLMAQAAAATDRGPILRTSHLCSAARNGQVISQRGFRGHRQDREGPATGRLRRSSVLSAWTNVHARKSPIAYRSPKVPRHRRSLRNSRHAPRPPLHQCRAVWRRALGA